MKITDLQVHEAFARATWGESVRSLARELGVDESSLRERFKRGGATPKEVRRLAFQMFHAQQQLAMLGEAERREVDRLVARAVARPRSQAKSHPET